MTDDESGINRYPNFDIGSFFETHGVEWSLNNSGDHVEVALNCPKCVEHGEPTPDTNKKCWVNFTKGAFHCYRCKWSGSIVKLVQGIANTSFEEAIKILVNADDLDPLGHLKLSLVNETYDMNDTGYELKSVDLPYGYRPIEGPEEYLTERGIPWKYAERHDWGYGDAGYCKDRIIVPYFMKGHLVYWQARATWQGKGKEFKKVFNPKGISAKGILYNYDVASEYEEIIITEGFIDAVKVGPDAVSTNGKRLHPEQAEFIKASGCKSVIMAWDSDSWTDGTEKTKARRAKRCSMQQAVDLLRDYEIKVRCAKLPEGRDPGSYRYLSPRLRAILNAAKEHSF